MRQSGRRKGRVGESKSGGFGKELEEKMGEMARGMRATMFELVCGLFMGMMHRLSWEEKVVVGVPVAGRGHIEGAKDIVGLLVNTVAFPMEIEEG